MSWWGTIGPRELEYVLSIRIFTSTWNLFEPLTWRFYGGFSVWSWSINFRLSPILVFGEWGQHRKFQASKHALVFLVTKPSPGTDQNHLFRTKDTLIQKFLWNLGAFIKHPVIWKIIRVLGGLWQELVLQSKLLVGLNIICNIHT